MTNVSSLGTSSPAVSPSVQTNKTATAAGSSSAQNAAQSFTTVTLGQSGGSAQVYTLPTAKPPEPPVWENTSSDAVSKLMGANNNASTLALRFKDIGAALLGRFDTESTGFSQSVMQFASGMAPGNALETTMQSQLHKTPDNQISLSIQTVGGAQVELTLGSTDTGLAVDVKVTKGTLSDSDREALSKLSGAFQKAIDGLTANPPHMDLTGLTQFDTTVLASVDLHASVKVNGDSQIIDFHADSKTRSVNSSGPMGAMKVAVDLSNPAIIGTAKQQAQAIAGYLKQFDYEQTRGHGDASLMGMFKDAFSQMNSNYPASQQQAGMPGVFKLNAEDHSLLTGLADFTASVTQNSQFSNPMHSNESDSFAYDVSQSSSVKGNGQLNRAITQHQQSHLTASYHEPLTPGLQLKLTTDKNSQNYYYTQIDDRASSDASIAYDLGALTKASLTQSASQSKRVQKYVMGNLESDVTTPSSSSWVMDYLIQFKAAQSANNNRTSQDNYSWELTLASINSMTVFQADPAQLSGRKSAAS
ncbi:hypothetical protein PQR63_14525 [Herbaspirillum rhizosphaerae]|uniref:Uncharacterized protein n=1 Tax=Herbaspirillum rhizosphaerae TaxID=346179 RepID=A0ABW8Z9B1_9BURK